MNNPDGFRLQNYNIVNKYDNQKNCYFYNVAETKPI